jgi:hypothetical protein
VDQSGGSGETAPLGSGLVSPSDRLPFDWRPNDISKASQSDASWWAGRLPHDLQLRSSRLRAVQAHDDVKTHEILAGCL